ncbi:MAG: CBS domain-containing protein [Acidobacteriota bacterium]|nr:CBS domain-containing protein [Acidobacteriota bacterium]MDE3189523.1 CBS domain-containing protein [Acidobacteriota bacterium]
MHIGGVMRVKLVTARPDQSAAEAIRTMLDAGVGSVLVVEGPELVGIFTERDVLRLAGAGASFGTVLLRDVMTPGPLSVSSDVTILDAAQMMGARNLRHLPVVEGGNLVGVVSIRDVLGFLAERLWAERDEAAHDTARTLLSRD